MLDISLTKETNTNDIFNKSKTIKIVMKLKCVGHTKHVKLDVIVLYQKEAKLSTEPGKNNIRIDLHHGRDMPTVSESDTTLITPPKRCIQP